MRKSRTPGSVRGVSGNGQRELTTAQVMDEICEYMTCQCAVYIGGHFILQGGKAR